MWLGWIYAFPNSVFDILKLRLEVISLTVNIIDFSELITQEGNQAKKYEELIEKAENEELKKTLQDLRDLSVKKLNILVRVVKEGPWGNWE